MEQFPNIDNHEGIPQLDLNSSTPTKPRQGQQQQNVIWRYISWVLSNGGNLNLSDLFNSLPRWNPLGDWQLLGNDLGNVLMARIYISLMRPFANFNRLLNSEAYRYPIQGIVFFYQHPELWSSLQVIPPHFAISWVIYCLVWSTLFPLQFVLATIFGGPIGIIIACVATLQQCHYYSSFVTNKVLLPEQLDAVFDRALISSDHYDVVLIGKARRITPVPFVTKFRRFMWSIPTEFLFYPLELARMLFPTIYNSLPILGPLIFSMVNASQVGIGYQKRYFILKNLKPEQVTMLSKKRMGHYASFGFVASILELTPLLGFIFTITNTVGAALYCADLEDELAKQGFGNGDRAMTVRGLVEIMP